uniref:Uncharacterized protein n=1 Tax=Ananas comosus var. bracteatus TaxID=296719 RepID=A0A6V7PY44_ANACO|nr:unnamed protein product [Ananas comosus var. bracteatus]
MTSHSRRIGTESPAHEKGSEYTVCSSFSGTFGMALEPCSEMFLLVLIQIWMLKWNLEHSKNLEIQLQGDKIALYPRKRCDLKLLRPSLVKLLLTKALHRMEVTKGNVLAQGMDWLFELTDRSIRDINREPIQARSASRPDATSSAVQLLGKQQNEALLEAGALGISSRRRLTTRSPRSEEGGTEHSCNFSKRLGEAYLLPVEWLSSRQEEAVQTCRSDFESLPCLAVTTLKNFFDIYGIPRHFSRALEIERNTVNSRIPKTESDRCAPAWNSLEESTDELFPGQSPNQSRQKARKTQAKGGVLFRLREMRGRSYSKIPRFACFSEHFVFHECGISSLAWLTESDMFHARRCGTLPSSAPFHPEKPMCKGRPLLVAVIGWRAIDRILSSYRMNPGRRPYRRKRGLAWLKSTSFVKVIEKINKIKQISFFREGYSGNSDYGVIRDGKGAVMWN